LAIFMFAACLCAGTIDVTSQSSQWLRAGDSLEFLFSSHSYVNYASGLGISPYPAAIDFTFASMPVSVAGQFTAELESTDGAVTKAFPDALSWSSGYAHNSGYSGPVSAIVGSVALSNTLSQTVFSNSEAELVLTYSGSPIDVGMQGNTLRQDLQVSLFGGPMSIGGMVYSVTLEDGGLTPDAGGIVRNGSQLPAAAEPNTGTLLLAGGGLCLLAGALKRIPRRRRQEVDRDA
jgi:hypothetical protein